MYNCTLLPYATIQRVCRLEILAESMYRIYTRCPSHFFHHHRLSLRSGQCMTWLTSNPDFLTPSSPFRPRVSCASLSFSRIMLVCLLCYCLTDNYGSVAYPFPELDQVPYWIVAVHQSLSVHMLFVLIHILRSHWASFQEHPFCSKLFCEFNSKYCIHMLGFHSNHSQFNSYVQFNSFLLLHHVSSTGYNSVCTLHVLSLVVPPSASYSPNFHFVVHLNRLITSSNNRCR